MASAVNGILIIDKPAGITSHDVVARLRRILGLRRIGHTGTLDPFATGVLVVCLNRATRLVRFLTGDDKEYRARLQLGAETATGDPTGELLSPRRDVTRVTRQEVSAALDALRGRLAQVPPMYSAKKVDGVRLYQLARRGETIERAPAMVEIREIELLAEGSDQSAGIYEFRVVCTSGTYIRALAVEVGRRLGVGAHLIELRRTRAGRCHLAHAQTLEGVEALVGQGALSEALMPIREALGMAEFTLAAEEARGVAHGRGVQREGAWRDGDWRLLLGPGGEVLAVASYRAGSGHWQPRVVIGAPDEP